MRHTGPLQLHLFCFLFSFSAHIYGTTLPLQYPLSSLCFAHTRSYPSLGYLSSPLGLLLAIWIPDTCIFYASLVLTNITMQCYTILQMPVFACLPTSDRSFAKALFFVTSDSLLPCIRRAPEFWEGLETGPRNLNRGSQHCRRPPLPCLPGPRALPSEVAEGGPAGGPGALTRWGLPALEALLDHHRGFRESPSPLPFPGGP